MKIHPDDFRVRPGHKVHLKQWPTRVKPFYRSKADCAEKLAEMTDALRRLQTQLYARQHYSLLVIFQAMDAAGKDSAIKRVMSGVNPQGCRVYSFKHPSAEELSHDFLWRTNRCLPERGSIGIFNRSYYEEVLIARVHPEIIQAQGLPREEARPAALWPGRYRSIVELEQHLQRNGTRVVKIFLHLSKEEQRLRFLARIDAPEKNWKFSANDLAERKRWRDYRKAYEHCLAATSTTEAPWHAVPADDKPNAHLIIAKIIAQALEAMKMKPFIPDAARARELRTLRRRLTA